MNGKDFLEYYDQICEITGIRWIVKGNPTEPDEAKVEFTIDGENVAFAFPFPDLPFEEREINYVVISMLVNKCIRDITGRNAVMLTIHGSGVTAADTITSSINYARQLLKENRQ